MKKLLAFLLILLMAAGCAGCSNQETHDAGTQSVPEPAASVPEAESTSAVICLEGPGYDTPEEAVLAYIDAMNRGDVAGMVSTFAIETYIEHVNPRLYLEHSKAVTAVTASVIHAVPYTDDFTRSLAAAARYSIIASDLKAAYSLYATDTASVRTQTAEDREALAEQFRQSPLHGMTGHVEFVQWLSPAVLTGGRAVTPGFGDSAAEQALFTGADDYTELAALLRINGKYACQPMGCAKYGSRWYNQDFYTRTASLVNIRESWKSFLWIPSDSSEEEMLTLALTTDMPEETARWNALQESERAGARWPLVSLDVPGITVHDSAAAAESDGSAGIWAEMHFLRIGGAVITITASPALQQQLGMSSATTRIRFSWFPDEIPVTRITKNGKTVPLFRFVNNRESMKLGLENLSVSQTDTAVTVMLADGTKVVFEKPSAAETLPAQKETVTAATRLESEGYGTPEEAVLAYLDALNRGDVRGMLSTFAAETWAAHADPMFYVEMLGGYHVQTTYNIPDSDDYARSLMAFDRYGTLARSLFSGWVSYAADLSRNIRLKEEEEIDSFLAQFPPSSMSEVIGNVSFTGWISPVSMTRGDILTPNSAASIARNVILSGADDIAFLIAEYQINGEKAYLPMYCVRYGDRWYNGDIFTDAVYTYIRDASHIQRSYVWLPTPEEQSGIDDALAGNYPEETAVWDSIRGSDLAGTRWQMTALDNPDITVHDTAAAAESDSSWGIHGEMQLTATGSVIVTLTCSPAMAQLLETDGATARIFCFWQPDSEDIRFTALTGMSRPSTNLPLDNITVTRDGSTITLAVSGVSVSFEQVTP